MPEMPEIFYFQRAPRAKTKGSCWLPKPGTCSSMSLAEVCYLKLQKTAQNGRFRRAAPAGKFIAFYHWEAIKFSFPSPTAIS